MTYTVDNPKHRIYRLLNPSGELIKQVTAPDHEGGMIVVSSRLEYEASLLNSATEALRQQLAAAQAENAHTNELLFAWQSWAQKTCEQMDDMPAVISGLTKDIITQHIQDLQAENAQLKALLDTVHDMSNTQYLNTDQLYHNVDSIHRQTKAYSTDTPARETTVNRCPNCQEIFGEPEDGLLTCTNCGLIQTKEN